MEEEKTVVETEASTTSEESVVNEEAQAVPTEQQDVQVPPPQGQASIEAVDEFGVPYKNRYMETQRKLQETVERLPQMIEEHLQKAKPKEQKYSISQLEEYAIQHPEHRPWVEEQKAMIIQENVAKIAEERVQKVEKKTSDEQKRAASYRYLQDTYPECFTRDVLGNVVYNNAHPISQHINAIMQIPEFRDNPQGLAMAADAAYGRFSRMQNPKSQKQLKSMQQTIRKVQKGSLVEGGGTNNATPAKDSLSKAKEELARTGSRSAAEAAVRAYLVKSGHINE